MKEVSGANISFLFDYLLREVANQVYFTLIDNVPGDLSEFGVYKGGASIVMASVLFFVEPETERKVHLFDSFEGHPDYDKTANLDFDPDLRGAAGKSMGSMQEVLHNLKHFGLQDRLKAGQIVLHKGWFKDTAPLLDRPLAIIRADGDAYTSTRDILVNTYHLLNKGGMVIIDDYTEYKSCKLAVDQFMANNSIPITELHYDHNLPTKPTRSRVFWNKKV